MGLRIDDFQARARAEIESWPSLAALEAVNKQRLAA
jgi:hypothetical protein